MNNQYGSNNPYNNGQNNGQYNNGLNNSFDAQNQNFRNSYNYGYNPYNQNGYYQNQMINNNNYNNMNKEEFSSSPPKNKKYIKKIIISIIILFVIIGGVYGSIKLYQHLNRKTRTFMIYMVGSDLESKSSQGTFSISDIVGENIDLQNNNVVLMAGGANEWHNFVNKDEIGIYRLTSQGFIKIESKDIISMGSSENLSYFLDFVYDRYPAKNYDLIFWNHGLGALGIEQDEVSSDYLNIYELDKAFKNSNFKDEKLEMTIFYNCLAGNVQIANIMSKYSNYMVASEEILYLSKLLNRFNFLEKVETSDTPYQIGYHFIEQSDSVMKLYNSSHSDKLDSTLSIFDLSKINNLNKKIDAFFNSIDLNKFYYSVSFSRMKLHTYGISQTRDYDTVDLYELVEALKPFSNDSKACDDLLNEINEFVMYTSSLNEHSNGVSIYFPYFGSDSAIELHLDLFNSLWNNKYTEFINNFYQIRSGAKLSIRSKTGKNINELKNEIVVNNNKISLELTDEEKEKYVYSNIYIFKKDKDNKYDLVLQSDDLTLEKNTLTFNYNGLLTINKIIVPSVIEDGKEKVNAVLKNDKNSLSVVANITNKKITSILLDSGDYPKSSIIELDDFDSISITSNKYDLVDKNKLNEIWNYSYEKSNSKDFEIKNITFDYEKVNLDDYYIMIELRDSYNDSYYSKIKGN